MNKSSIFSGAILTSFCLVTTVTAQVSITPAPKPFIDISSVKTRINQLKTVAGVKGTENPEMNNLVNLSADILKAKLMKSTSRFHIFELPVDNMQCLVPNNSFQSNMPTMKEFYNERNSLDFSNNIPNRFKKEELLLSETIPADR